MWPYEKIDISETNGFSSPESSPYKYYTEIQQTITIEINLINLADEYKCRLLNRFKWIIAAVQRNNNTVR